MNINELLSEAVNHGASDVLLAADAPPMFRIDGQLDPFGPEPLTPQRIEQLCDPLLSDEHREKLPEEHDVDFAAAIDGIGRFRFNVHRQRGSLAAAIRYIADEAQRLEDLGLPDVIEELTRLPSGLVLVTGQTGSGKSTTLAAMINRINRRDARHIITLEDPIEFLFQHDRSLIEQREIGSDCPSFASGLRHVLRQDPDVILVGELRDLETIRIAMQAAETGHLVLATLHSSSAPGSIDRIVEVFPPQQQAQIRSHLTECLRAVVTQQLLPAAAGHGRVAALEILISTRAVQTNIREGHSHLLHGILSTGSRLGMQTMQQAVKELVLNGRISLDAADEYLDDGVTTTASV